MGGRAKARMILGGKRNLGRKPRAKDFESGFSKAIWDQPDFSAPEEFENNIITEIKSFLSLGFSVREISEKLNLDQKEVKRIYRACGAQFNQEWIAARNARQKEKALQRLANPEFLAQLSNKQKDTWIKRKADNAALSLPEDEQTANDIISKYSTQSSWQINKFVRWSRIDEQRLRILAEANIEPNIAANIFKRSEKTIAYKARDLAISMPLEWVAFLPKSKYIAHPREPKILLNYPFMVRVSNEDEDHAILIAVNKLVPKGIPDHMRGDICQDIILAIYEGKVNLTTLQKSPKLVREHINRWRNENLEQGGHAIHFDPWGDDDREWGERLAAKIDWDRGQHNDALSNWEAQSIAFTPPTQFEEVYQKDLHAEHQAYCDKGISISIGEVEQNMEKGERISLKKSLVPARIKIAKHIIGQGLILSDPRVLSPSYSGEGYNVNQWLGFADSVFLKAMQSQYIKFAIPDSNIRELEIRIADHAAHADKRFDLDTYALGIDGVMRVISELADNVSKYESVYRKHGDMSDILTNGLEGL